MQTISPSKSLSTPIWRRFLLHSFNNYRVPSRARHRTGLWAERLARLATHPLSLSARGSADKQACPQISPLWHPPLAGRSDQTPGSLELLKRTAGAPFSLSSGSLSRLSPV